MYFTVEQQNFEPLGTELLYKLEIAQGQKKCHHQGCFWQARSAVKAKWQHIRCEDQHPWGKRNVEDGRGVILHLNAWHYSVKRDRGESSPGGRGEDKIGTRQEAKLSLPLFLASSFSLLCAQNCAQRGWCRGHYNVGESWRTLGTEFCPLSTQGLQPSWAVVSIYSCVS